MNLPSIPEKYDPAQQAQTRAGIEEADAANHKKFRDIEVGKACRLILVDTVTGTRYAATVASGAWVLTAL